MSNSHPIVFFDGVCGLCNNTVRFLIGRDHKHHLRFSTLQGLLAKEILDPQITDSLTTLIFFENGKVFTHSTAVIKAIGALGGCYSLMTLFLIIPKVIRDWVYSIISSHRYQWFGKYEVCRLPTDAEKAFFLD